MEELQQPADAWFGYKAKTIPFTLSLLVSLNCQQLLQLEHLPWYFPAVTLICLLCIKDLCRPAKQSISTSLEAICTLKHQSREHNIFLFLKIWILHPLRQPLLQRAGRNELSSKAQIYPNNTAQARLHFKNKWTKFSSSSHNYYHSLCFISLFCFNQ